MSFEEATIGTAERQQPNPGNQPPDDPTMLSTDDLVFMIGEGAVRERQLTKTIRFLNQKAVALQRAVNQCQCAELKRQNESYQKRILDLEKQVHETALERDGLAKTLEKIKGGRKQRKNGE